MKIYDGNEEAKIKKGNETEELSHTFCNEYIEEAIEEIGRGINIQRQLITTVRFAEDIVIHAESKRKLQSIFIRITK